MSKKLGNAELIQQDSGNVEWYTPRFITEFADYCMGGVDLDPASCERANTIDGIIRAKNIFTKEDDGLTRRWDINGLSTKVWVNWPYSAKYNPDWVSKIIGESKRVESVMCIHFMSTDAGWFNSLFDTCTAMSFVAPRVSFLVSGTLQPSVGTPKGVGLTLFTQNQTTLQKFLSVDTLDDYRVKKGYKRYKLKNIKGFLR